MPVLLITLYYYIMYNGKKESFSITVLGELFKGTICPFENLTVKNDSEYDKFGDKISDEGEYFKSLLNAKDGERFDSLWDLEHKHGTCEVREGFISGFKLAVKMMAEVYTDKSVAPSSEM